MRTKRRIFTESVGPGNPARAKFAAENMVITFPAMNKAGFILLRQLADADVHAECKQLTLHTSN